MYNVNSHGETNHVIKVHAQCFLLMPKAMEKQSIFLKYMYNAFYLNSTPWVIGSQFRERMSIMDNLGNIQSNLQCPCGHLY